jgi:hypothetical protein
MTRKTEPGAFSDLLKAPRIFDFIQKFEVEQDANDFWLRKTHLFFSVAPSHAK